MLRARSIAFAPVALAALALRSPAQSFNIDIDTAVPTVGTPPTTYGASAQSPGWWNAVGHSSSTALLATNGTSTGVTISNNATEDYFLHVDDPNTTGNDQRLLDDFEKPEDYLVTWTIAGLANGTYQVDTITNGNNVGRVRIWVTGSTDPVEYAYGNWTGAWVEGGPEPGFPSFLSNYVRQSKVVTDGQIQVNVEVADNPADYVYVNAIQLVKDGEVLVGVPMCFGDGSESPCPCANSGTAAHGCQTSAGTGGALLRATGATSPDTVVLHSSGELPSSISIFLQGNAAIPQTTYGDGLRCAGGILKRLYTAPAVAGSISRPGAGDPSITARSAALGDPIVPGERRYYQVYFRDGNAAWCPLPTGNSFNVSNAVKITW